MYKTDGSVTFQEYEKPTNSFSSIHSKLIVWENKLNKEKDYVSNEKINYVKKLLKYLKQENAPFYSKNFKKYNLKNDKM